MPNTKPSENNFSHHNALSEMPQYNIYTALTPAIMPLYNMMDAIVVVIDILRATSTITTAMYYGAQYIIPTNDIQHCQELGKKLNAITAGERNGDVIRGLDCGNSPQEFATHQIKDKIIALTTTNGTRTIQIAQECMAHQILIGSFLNLTTLSDYLIKQKRNIIFACSGWKDRINIEDTMFAGAVIQNIKHHFKIECDASLMALYTYERSQDVGMGDFIKTISHYERLTQFNKKADIDFCFKIDMYPILPFVEKKSNKIII